MFIRNILSANGYPLNFVNSCITKFKTKMEEEHYPKFGPNKKEINIKLPYKGNQSLILRRQLYRLFATVAPWVKVNVILHASNKLSRLCKLKCPLPTIKQSGVIYKIKCKNCSEFYIGMTKRRLETRINEHKKDENSALLRHSIEMDHIIDFCSSEILTKDTNSYRLQIKETLKIQEHFAYKSLNGNSGSLMLKLW